MAEKVLEKIGGTSGHGTFEVVDTDGVVGIRLNGEAAAVGQLVESTVLVGAAVALTTATAANVTSISLTAGDWDVWGNVWFNPTTTANITIHQGAINTTTAALPTAPGAGAIFKNMLVAGQVPNVIFGGPVGMIRLSLAATTTVFLVAQATFTIAALGAYGYIGARRRA